MTEGILIDLNNLDEEFTANDRYLVAEHLSHGTDDFLMAGVGSANFIVPYKYRKAGKNEVDAITSFKRDLLDFQFEEVAKYRKAGLRVRMEEYDGEKYVVPFKSRELNVSPMKLAKYVEIVAMKKYNFICETHRKLAKNNRNIGLTDFSSEMAEKYLLEIEKRKTMENAAKIMEVKRVADKNKGKKSNIFGMSAEDISGQLEKLAQRTWQVFKKRKKTVSISVMLSVFALSGVSMCERDGDKKSESATDKIETVDVVDMYSYTRQGDVYVDFMGKKHSDSLGNISRIMELKPDISALLIAVEGYADSTYKDGEGVPTIGSGTTFYLDDYGNDKKVEVGDKTTPEKAMKDKWRFIEKEIFPLLGDKIGRKCDDGELMACIGAAFCWGKTSFAKSEFYKSVRNGADKTDEMRKLTGFRRQKGLLKRSHVLSGCLLGKLSANDLLDLPIYNIPGKGYLNCAPYRLELHEIMPCKSDANGHYLKDKSGNDMPLIAEDGFGEFYSNYKAVHKKMCDRAKESREDYCCVRDLLPEDMLANINHKAGNSGQGQPNLICMRDSGR